MSLKEFIKQEINKPFIWGETDCCSTTDRWVKNLTGFSPLENFGRKASPEWLGEKGIVKPVVKVINKFKLLKKTSYPKAGDIGLILMPNNICALSIKTEKFWFVRNESGIIGAPIETQILRAWSCQV